MSEQDNIDLQKLSQRELLIVTYRKVEELTGSLKEIGSKQETHEVRIAVIETKVKIWAAIIGGAAALVVEFITNLTK